MAITAETLVTEFKGETRDLDRAFQRAERGAQQHVSRVNRTLSGMGRGVSSGLTGSGGLLSTLSNISNIVSAIPQIGQLAGALIRPLTDATRAGVEFNAFLETAQIGFTTLVGSADAAREHIAALQRFGAQTPFQFRDLINASRFMQAFGFEAREVIPSLTAVGNALSAAGNIGSDALDGVIRQLGQMRSVNRVTAQDMNAITNNGIPAWTLLAEAIGKSVAETRRLAESGRLSGRVASDLILEASNRRYGGAMGRMQGTLTQTMSNIEDALEQAGGLATQTIARDFTQVAQAALSQEDLVMQMARSLNTSIAPVSGLVRTAMVSLIGGGITGGLTEGVNAGRSMVSDAIRTLGLDSVIGTFRNVLGIRSPSTVFYEMGVNSAQGFLLGLEDGLSGGSIPRILNQALGQQRGRGRIGGGTFSSGDPAIDAAIQRNAQRTGVPAELLFAQLQQESGFNPRARSRAGALGIAQFMPGTARRYGLSNPFDPIESIRAQADYMRDLLRQFGGNESLALAGYNAGENRASLRAGRIPNIPETQNYVASISAVVAQIRSGITASNPLPVTITNPYQRPGSAFTGGAQNPDLYWDRRDTFRETGVEGAFGRPNMPSLPALMRNWGLIAPNVGALPPAFGPAMGHHYGQLPPVMPGTTPNAQSGRGFTVEEAQENFRRISAMGNETWGQLKQGFQSVFMDAFSNVEGGFKGMTGRFLVGFAQMLLQMQMQALAARIGEAIFGGGEGRGGLLGKILGAVIGGAAGGAAGAALPNPSSGFAGIMMPSFGGSRAAGGDVKAGMLYETHGLKDGREWFIPSQNGYVANQQQMGGTTIINNTINVPVSRASGYSQPRNRRELGDDIARALRLAYA